LVKKEREQGQKKKTGGEKGGSLKKNNKRDEEKIYIRGKKQGEEKRRCFFEGRFTPCVFPPEKKGLGKEISLIPREKPNRERGSTKITILLAKKTTSFLSPKSEKEQGNCW